MVTSPQLGQPVFTAPVRWTLRVLAWAAFGVSAYLAWHAVTGTHVAGCGVGGENGCDMVLSSTWSKWLGMPVAVPGLACYASLAALSVLLGIQNPRSSRWINTAFVMLAAVAAVASLWFLALQVFAIGHYCRFCIVTDLCGIALGTIAVWSTARWLHDTRYLRKSRIAATGLMALRTALPAGTRTAPVAVGREYPAPSLAMALGGAGGIAVLLIGGQLLFPAKSYDVQQVALQEKIVMNSSNGEAPSEPRPFEADPQVVMRIPTEADSDDDETADAGQADSEVVAAGYEEPAHQSTPNRDTEPAAAGTTAAPEQNDSPSAPDESPPTDAEPRRERLIEFLGGKLTLDVYKHPLIGPPEAQHVLVEMVSYDCKHCRATHRTVKRALSRYGDQVAIIVMVVPLERGCNKLVTNAAVSHRGACSTARMVLGVAALKPAAFAKFHDWLMADKEKPPALASIIGRAYNLVDRERLRELSGSEQLKKQIEGYVDLFAALGKQNAGNKEFGLPVQILGDHVIAGSVEKPTDLYEAWEKHLGVKPR